MTFLICGNENSWTVYFNMCKIKLIFGAGPHILKKLPCIRGGEVLVLKQSPTQVTISTTLRPEDLNTTCFISSDSGEGGLNPTDRVLSAVIT